MSATQPPVILDVETGMAPADAYRCPLWKDVIDYHVYDHWPRWWRRIEQTLRLDFALAWEVKRIAGRYDILWVWSEKVGIPLSLLRVRTPIVVVCHNLGVIKMKMIKWLGLHRRWSGAGYISDADREIMTTRLGIPADQLFRTITAPLDECRPTADPPGGPIMSLGVAKRDYPTLIAALEQLPGYETDIYVSSRYGNDYCGRVKDCLPGWVHFAQRVERPELISRYQRARFVVLPLVQSAQAGAGATVALEASACGKAIIATRTAGMPTFVIDGQTGILVPPNDVTAMRAAIRRLGEDPQLALQMGKAGRKYVEEIFAPDKVNAQIIAVLNRIYAEECQSMRLSTLARSGWAGCRQRRRRSGRPSV